MTTILRDDPEPDYGVGFDCGCFLAALVGLLIWAVVVWIWILVTR